MPLIPALAVQRLAATIAFAVCAFPAELPQARSVMDEVFARTLSRPLRYEGVVTVTDSGGALSEKRWLVERKGTPGRSRVVVRFLSPPEVKGVALLIVSQPGREADQWLYTPAIARVRRVVQHSRGSRFYATDLTFEDLEESETTISEFQIEGVETVEGEACWRINARPLRKSAYNRRLLWVSQARYVILRQDLYSSGACVKRMLARGYSQRQGIWTPATLEAADLTTGSRTVITLTKVAYDVSLPDHRFTPEALSTPLP